MRQSFLVLPGGFYR